ncbi:HlyD family secretion protein, partial [Prochlorococcus sp. AH-736-L23]|nr:HlyD family secretion protein [Prochlorococcus sp. AH-736-L23]
ISIKDSNITSPLDGNVFELIPKNSGYYTNAGDTLMKIVPDGELEAKIFVKNSDIGFVKEGMQAEIRVDAYPFSRFGSLSGRVINIGDEVLPADNLNPQSRFPVYLNIDSQFLTRENNKYLIKAGQSINVNLIVKERPVITIFSDIFSNSIDSLKSIKSNK